MSGESRELVRLVAIPRGKDDTEELRISLDEFEPDNGRPSKYVSARIWYLTGEEWRPTKKGVTVRARELDAVIVALTKARDAMNGKGAAVAKPKREPEPERSGSDGEIF